MRVYIEYTLKHIDTHTHTHTHIHTHTHTQIHKHTLCERVVFAGTECSSPSIGNEWVGKQRPADCRSFSANELETLVHSGRWPAIK